MRPEEELVHRTGSGTIATPAGSGHLRKRIVPHRTTTVAVTAYSSDGCMKMFDKGWRVWVPLRERVSDVDRGLVTLNSLVDGHSPRPPAIAVATDHPCLGMAWRMRMCRTRTARLPFTSPFRFRCSRTSAWVP